MNLRDDHFPLPDSVATRRYFAKFERIIGHLHDVYALTPNATGEHAEAYLDVIGTRLGQLSRSFKALSFKYLVARHVSDTIPMSMEIDRRDSGFPVYKELLQMGNDLTQAQKHLDGLPSERVLKREMVEHILRERTQPRRLQFALSQRIYYEALMEGQVFLPQNHPEAVLLGEYDEGVRGYLVHWAVYDSQANLPALYLMVVVDSGKVPLVKDERRWPSVQSHLVAQSLNSLKLLTIASGFDSDFEDLHPKRLLRIHIGPMYSNTFTLQDGPLREVLSEANGGPGMDWALAWTVEDLVSQRTETQTKGVFGSVKREIYALDHYAVNDDHIGATTVDRSLILPQRPYQVLVNRDPQGLRNIRKFVVGDGGHVSAHM